MSTAKGTGLVAASVEYSKVAVQITHIRSNQNRTQFERTRMLFDFVRAAFAGPRTACTDLSRRLRDGVSLVCHVSFPPHHRYVASGIISGQAIVPSRIGSISRLPSLRGLPGREVSDCLVRHTTC